MDVNERIKQLRNDILKNEKGKRYSKRDFADKMGVSHGVINNIDRNLVEAKDNVIKLISLTFGVNEEWIRNGVGNIFNNQDNNKDLLKTLSNKYNLNPIAYKIIENYLEMPSNKKELFHNFLSDVLKDVDLPNTTHIDEDLEDIPMAITTDDTNIYDILHIKVFEMPVSAGAGVLLTDDVPHHLEEFNVKKTPQARSADFALYIRGDSMEPMYYDGDIVFVKKQPSLNNGQIGIFIYEGEAYLKEYLKNDDKTQLISLNEKYKPIDITNDTCKICGFIL